MSDDWEMLFHEDAMQFVLALRDRERHLIMQGLAKLIANPYQRPDAFAKGSEGRNYSVKYLGAFRVAYWLDTFVKEFRVVEIKRVAIK